ncbi:MAG: TIGR02147 family protein [Pseudobdellovibrionaceae bacterium]
MSPEMPEYVQILMEEFEKSKSTNKRYSVRAFAKRLGIHPATLSSILKGHRKVPRKQALEITEKLKLSPSRRNRFLRSLQKREDLRESLSEQVDYESSHQQFIALAGSPLEWEYSAVLSLLEIEKNWTAESIAKKLKLNPTKCQEILASLVDSHWLVHEENRYLLSEKPGNPINGSVPSRNEIQIYERDLQLALAQLKNPSTRHKNYSFQSMAINKKRLPEAQKLIQNFHRELNDLLQDGDPTDVFHLAIQFFPLTSED